MDLVYCTRPQIIQYSHEHVLNWNQTNGKDIWHFEDQLRVKGYMNEVFFVDATHLIAKSQLWRERDEAIRQKYGKLNNDILSKVAHDKEARIEYKGTNQFWYGYKKHVSVDMQKWMRE